MPWGKLSRWIACKLADCLLARSWVMMRMVSPAVVGVCLQTDGRQAARGRSTLVSNMWEFKHAYFCRALVNNLQSVDEFKLAVWPFDAWREGIRNDYAWMATMNAGKPLELSVTEAEEQRKREKPEYTETRFPVY